MDWIVGSSILIYFATVITEIVSSVPVGLTLSQFGGNCILYASTTYNPFKTNMTVTSFGSTSSCEFCTYLTIVTVLYALGYGSYSTYALYKSSSNASMMWVLPAIMVCFLLFILKFISSCILSVGYSQFCKSVTSQEYISTCKEAQYHDANDASIKWFYASGKGPTAVPDVSYYAHMTTAQSASWFCTFEWFLLTGLAVLHYRRNVALRSTGKIDGGFGATDTEGIVANEVLPGT